MVVRTVQSQLHLAWKSPRCLRQGLRRPGCPSQQKRLWPNRRCRYAYWRRWSSTRDPGAIARRTAARERSRSRWAVGDCPARPPVERASSDQQIAAAYDSEAQKSVLPERVCRERTTSQHVDLPPQTSGRSVRRVTTEYWLGRRCIVCHPPIVRGGLARRHRRLQVPNSSSNSAPSERRHGTSELCPWRNRD